MLKKFNLPLILILFLALFLRLPPVLQDFFPFVFDMGRDMLWVRDIVVLKKPYLIGPWGSLSGVFFGPGWYYLLSIPFVITGGDPRGSVFLVLFLNLLTIFLAYVFGKKIKGERFGRVLAFLLTISPLMINISTYAFHANLLPLTTLVFIYSLWQVLQGQKGFLLLAALATSLNFHFEPAWAIFSTLTALVFIGLKFKSLRFNFRNLTAALVVFCVPFVPQMIFELRHNFLQTKALISFFKGENESLGGKLPLFPERVTNRFEKFFETFKTSIISGNQILIIFIVLLTIFLVWKIYPAPTSRCGVYKKEDPKIKNLIFVLALLLLIPFLGFTLLFPPELKGWYLYSLPVAYGFLVALVLEFLLEKGQNYIYFFLLILFFVNTSPVTKFKDCFRGYKNGGPEILKSQKKVIDWVYQETKGQPFRAYVYTPPIYDYHYQYLFWWYGNKKFGYLPEEYSYLPGETVYVPHKEYYVNPHPQETDLVYLIIEPEEIEQRLQGWLGHFSQTDLEKKIKLNSGIVIEKREAT